jgi:hypothetical protein
MERRSLLAVLGTVALAGCAGGAPSNDGSGGNGGDGDAPTIADSDVVDTGECASPETATVTFGSARVDVTGCITGANGCSTAVLGSATMEGDELHLVVDTDDTPEGDVGCTQALVQRGYEASVAFDGGVPAAVSVVHDSATGREQVTRAERP